MYLGLIAAGEGSRLRSEGIALPKGLVPVAGTPLIRRAIESFVTCGIEGVKCIVNEESKELEDYLRNEDFGVPIELIVKSTPSSMHSLFALAPLLQDTPFFLATVDAVYNQEELTRYVEFCRRAEDVDGVIGVTSFIEDEKPLYVTMDEDQVITVIGERAAGSDWVTGGVYYFSPSIFKFMDVALNSGMERLRKFQELLVDEGCAIRGYPFEKIVDVDHRTDIDVAERFLSEISDAGTES